MQQPYSAFHDADDARYWLGLSLVPEIGVKRLTHLVQAFGSAENAWRAPASDLRACGLDDRPIGNLLAARGRLDLNAEWDRVLRAGARVLKLNDPDYPALLRAAPDPPPVLYIRGQLTPHDDRALAVVGTRRMSAYGRETTELFSRELAAQGITIISGLAHGIDAAAHHEALRVGGRTIAVFGSGIDSVYPPEHRGLAERIAEQGALISEFPIGAKAESRHFPRRNRILSGLSLGVLVIEAPEKSGSLITATFAAEQGRDVFAVPGNIFHPNSAGTHELIQEGAKLVYRPQDILDELQISYQHMHTREAVRQTVGELAPDNDEERTLFRLLREQAAPTHADDLTRMSGMASSLVVGTLTVMELKGLIRNVGAMCYAVVQR